MLLKKSGIARLATLTTQRAPLPAAYLYFPKQRRLAIYKVLAALQALS